MSKPRNDRKLALQIVAVKVLLELYIAAIVTLLYLERGGCL